MFPSMKRPRWNVNFINPPNRNTSNISLLPETNHGTNLISEAVSLSLLLRISKIHHFLLSQASKQNVLGLSTDTHLWHFSPHSNTPELSRHAFTVIRKFRRERWRLSLDCVLSNHDHLLILLWVLSLERDLWRPNNLQKNTARSKLQLRWIGFFFYVKHRQYYISRTTGGIFKTE